MRSRWPLLIPVILLLPYGIYLSFALFGPSGVFAGLAGATLVLALVGLWSSVRGTLAGAEDAALDLSQGSAEREALLESKRTLLRALKDLEHERQVGKLDERDYQRLSASYRASAKEVLEQLDQDLGPYLERARTLAGGADVHGRAYTRKADAKAQEPRAKREESAVEPAPRTEDDVESEAAPESDAAPDERAAALASQLAGLSDDKRREAEAFLAKLAERPEDDA